ncbi:MAG: discoidin domain-containing protein, partial [Planctomycetes bacterium]|nr:discoidin domain-containing protein [Planctomycetota bacterium]
LDNDGGTNYTNSGPVVAPPYFVKIERVGDTFSGLYSPDGITWTQLGESQTIVMGETALIGLAVTSHAGGELRTYTFDTLGFSGGVSGLADPGTASNPSPEDEDSDVIRDTLLTWTPGQYPGTHDVYFGSSFEDVNSATVPAAAGLDVNSFAPGRLEFGQTYYWRADEVNGTPDKTVFKGEVWSFTAEPYSILIPGAEVAVTASSSANEFSLPEKLTDGSGMGEDGTHAIVPESMWFTAAVDLDPWVQFDFDGIKQLDIMKIWNSNGAAESAIGWGVKDVVIEYSVDGENWTVLPDANQISRAPGLTTYAQADEIAFSGVPAKMVRLDIGSNWGGILMSYGLSEVQFTMIPAAVRTPEPASGTTGVQPGDTVTWRAGREVDTHTLYIGTDANAVADGTAPSVTTSTTSLDLGTLGLELGDTYYWRV